jgi:S-adenosylmethionine decarboxylase
MEFVTALPLKSSIISETAAIGEVIQNVDCPGSPSDVGTSESEYEKYSDDEETSAGASLGSSSVLSNEESHVTPEYVPGTFEGPEKTMEVVFSPNIGHEDGLRALTREQLDYLCTQAKCTILSKISSSYMDAYVLSESSLFVYKHRYIMKTCGTTTLLRCLSSLLHFADKLGMALTWVGYSRKNLLFPSAQQWPHSNFGEEIKYMNTHAKLQERLRGTGHILGPITGDHWFVYVADHPHARGLRKNAIERPLSPRYSPRADDAPTMERTINMMMFDMAPEVASIFFKSNSETGKEMTSKSGINTLCPGATIDETAFTPCGYSMNAILHDAYFTVHITPEQECSYCSFETNAVLRNYSSLVRNVLTVFRPKRFVLTMFGDEAAVDALPELPTDPKIIPVTSLGMYKRTSLASTKVEADLCCMMGCYSLDDSNKNVNPADVAPAIDCSLSSANRRTSSDHLNAVKARERGYSLV